MMRWIPLLQIVLISAVVLGPARPMPVRAHEPPAEYRVVQPAVGDPFELRAGFDTFEPQLAGDLTAAPAGSAASMPASRVISGWGGAGHMILLHDGRLLLAFASQNKCRIAESRDNGVAWSPPRVVDAPLPDEFKDARIHRPAIVQTSDSRLHLFFYGLIKYDAPNPEKSINPLWTTRSSNGGKTWSAPRRILDGYVGMLQGAIVTSKGNIVVPVCRYSGVHRYASLCVVSRDGGETWEQSNVLDVKDPAPDARLKKPLSASISRGAVEPSVAELPDERLLMMIRTVGDAMCQSHSTDGGLTWSPPERSGISCGGPGNVVRLPSGRIVIAYNPANFESAMAQNWGSPIGYDRQSIAILNDDGQSWTITHDFVRQVEKASRVVHSTVTGLRDGTVLINLPGRSTLLRTSEASLLRGER